MKKELLVSLSDIEAFVVECPQPNCRSQIRITRTAQVQFTDVLGDIDTLERCPACKNRYGPAFRRKLIGLMTAVLSSDGMPDISFQVSADDLLR